jgi:hypothetical protein
MDDRFIAHYRANYWPSVPDNQREIEDANAHLIAAAPELLAALKKLCAEVQEYNCADIVLDEYYAAIDKAKEET